jgi:penicillin-binding protein 1A
MAKKKTKQKRKTKGIIKFLWFCVLFGIISVVALIFLIDSGRLGEMPSMAELQNPKSAIASEIYDGDDNLIGKLFAENREPVSYKEISPAVIDALVATEDERFYSHSGIDAEALGRVLRGVLTAKNEGGGSTITQQLAKNLFPRKERSLFKLIYYKLKEMILAVKIEKNLTKQEILTAYLNTVPFGYNSWGIRSASRTFFNKEPMELETQEAAVLVGMLKGTTLYNPKRNPETSKKRRNTVLSQMLKNKKISNSEYQRLKVTDLVIDFKRVSDQKHEGLAPYFRQVVELKVKEWCKKKGMDVYRDGLKIYTTINPKMQEYAELAVARNMYNKTRRVNNFRWKKHPKTLQRIIRSTERYKTLKAEGYTEKEIEENFNTKVKMTVFAWNDKREKEVTMTPLDSIKYMRAFVQTGFAAMDPATGEVKAWVGGINHKYFQYDHVNENTKRQVGSTMKPLAYCLAVDNNYSPCTPISCRPVFFPGHRLYNAGGSRYGTLPMKNVLAYSLNNGSLRVLKMVGIEAFVDFCKKVGITTELKAYPSIVLGAQDISVIEMLRSYTMFPNYGINIKPTFITRIEDKNGNLLETFVPERKEVINERTAYKMIKMMQGTVNFGTAKRLKGRYGLKGELCGKTGTTNDEADAWYIGYSPQLLGGAWVGCEDRFMGLGLGAGSQAAMPIWGSFWKMVQKDKSLGYNTITKFEEPASMEGMDICDSYDQISIQRSESVENVSRGLDLENVSESEINRVIGGDNVQDVNTSSGADANDYE